MKKIISISIFMMILISGRQSTAQLISPEAASLNQRQLYWRDHKSDLKLEKNSVEVLPDKIPVKLQKTLDNNELYKGWQGSPLYLDKSTNLYTLYIKKDSTITAYGFNQRGKAVTYDSYTVHSE